MTNAEKYAGQIADTDEGVCVQFVKLEALRCSYCPLHGCCNDKDMMTKWLKQEVN